MQEDERKEVEYLQGLANYLVVQLTAECGVEPEMVPLDRLGLDVIERARDTIQMHIEKHDRNEVGSPPFKSID